MDFLIKIGTIVDVERSLIQVRHGPSANVEVLPLTMVNLLQRMNSGALVNEATTILKNAHVNDNSDRMLDQDNIIMPEEDDASTSASEASTDGSEHCEWDSHQLKQVNCEDEFKDTEFEDLVKSEGP
jgi:hypothetical protein